MDEQSRPEKPQDGQGTEDTEGTAGETRSAGIPAAEQTGKLRPAYLDPRGSEATRELRDTARRRRDAEEKLQQHLMEAKHHIPNEFHEHHDHGLHGHEQQAQRDPAHGRPEPEQPSEQPQPGAGENGAGTGENGEDS